MLVISEADKIIKSGHSDSLYKLFDRIPKNVQIVLTCSTLSQDVMEICNRIPNALFLRKKDLHPNCALVAVEKDEYKIDAICQLIHILKVPHCVIFIDEKNFNPLAVGFRKKGLSIKCIQQRKNMGKLAVSNEATQFLSGKNKLLIASLTLDEAIKNVPLKIYLDTKQNMESHIRGDVYLHDPLLKKWKCVSRNGLHPPTLSSVNLSTTFYCVYDREYSIEREVDGDIRDMIKAVCFISCKHFSIDNADTRFHDIVFEFNN